MSQIISTGSALPSLLVTSETLEKKFNLPHQWITSRTGIQTRSFSDPKNKKDDLVSLATEAARDCLKNAKTQNPIDCILVATCSHLLPIPSVACHVQNELTSDFLFSLNVWAMDINAACSGFLYAWIQAEMAFRSGMIQNALIIGADVLSPLTCMDDPDTAVLFSDGAGAFFLEKKHSEESPIKGISIGGNAADFNFLNQNSNTKKITMSGSEVFKSSIRTMETRMTEACEKAEIKLTDVDFWIPHQANSRIIETLAKRLSIPLERFGKSIDRYGNNSAATIPLTLNDCLKNDTFDLHKIIGFFAFGAGSTSAAIIYSQNEQPIKQKGNTP